MSRPKRGAIVPVNPRGAPIRFDFEPEYEVAGEEAIIEVVARPRRKSATFWDGVEPIEVSLLLTLDRLAKMQSLEADLRALHRLVRRDARVGRAPIVRVAARWEYPNRRWWVRSVTPEGERLARADGRRVVQDVRVELVEFVAVRVILSPAARVRAKRKKP